MDSHHWLSLLRRQKSSKPSSVQLILTKVFGKHVVKNICDNPSCDAHPATWLWWNSWNPTVLGTTLVATRAPKSLQITHHGLREEEQCLRNCSKQWQHDQRFGRSWEVVDNTGSVWDDSWARQITSKFDRFDKGLFLMQFAKKFENKEWLWTIHFVRQLLIFRSKAPTVGEGMFCKCRRARFNLSIIGLEMLCCGLRKRIREYVQVQYERTEFWYTVLVVHSLGSTQSW